MTIYFPTYISCTHSSVQSTTMCTRTAIKRYLLIRYRKLTADVTPLGSQGVTVKLGRHTLVHKSILGSLLPPSRPSPHFPIASYFNKNSQGSYDQYNDSCDRRHLNKHSSQHMSFAIYNVQPCLGFPHPRYLDISCGTKEVGDSLKSSVVATHFHTPSQSRKDKVLPRHH